MSTRYLNQNLPQQNINIRCNDLTVDGQIIEYNPIASVTQTGSISTPVTLNAHVGKVTTVSATLAANSKNLSTTVNNNVVDPDDMILLSFIYNGTDGHPHINIKNVNNGNFNFSLYNSSSTEALNGTLDIFFKVIKKS